MIVARRAAWTAGFLLSSAPLWAQEAPSRATAPAAGKAPAQAAVQQPSATGEKKAVRNPRPDSPFLGVGVMEVHAAFLPFLREHLSSEQGLIVEDVSEGSGADKAGIEPDDILIAIDGQKLFTPDQLAKLVQGDKIGHEVSIDLLRDGKRQTIKATLGARPREEQRRWSHEPSQGTSDSAAPTRGSGWENFDSLTLKRLKDNRFKAEVSYLDQDNKARHHVFEGTRQEIRKDIQAQKDLKPEERRQLLQSLGFAPYDQFQGGFFPGFGWMGDDEQMD